MLIGSEVFVHAGLRICRSEWTPACDQIEEQYASRKQVIQNRVVLKFQQHLWRFVARCATDRLGWSIFNYFRQA